MIILAARNRDLPAELVGTLQPFPTSTSIPQSEDKSPPIRVASAPSIPIYVRKSCRDLPVLSQSAQHGIDRLPLGCDDAHSHWTILESKYLWTQHRSVSNAQQLLLSGSRIIPCDDEEPGAIRRAMNMRGLHQTVQSLLFNWKHVKVPLGRRSHRLHKIFQRIMVDPVPKIKEKNGNFRVGQEQWTNATLRQILDYCMVICKVAIVHECLMHSNERVCTSRMPNPSFRWIPM